MTTRNRSMCFGPNSTYSTTLTTMPEPVRITTTLESRGPAAAVLLTDEQLAAIGHGAKTPPVRVTVNDGYTFAGRIGRMGGETLLGFNKANRTGAGVEAGDTITIDVVLDDAPREVVLPDELQTALTADAAARAAFDALAYSHRKEYARWVGEAKRPETRAKRVAETVTGALAGKTRT